MKLMTIFLFVAVINAGAVTNAQTVTYSANGESLAKVFEEIKKQTGYVFFFRNADLNNSEAVTVSLRNADVIDAITAVLAGQPFKFTVKKNTVSVFRWEEKPVPPIYSTEKIRPPVFGFVSGPDGKPLAGVNITVKGTKKGVTSGDDGAFLINVSVGDVVLISSIGYAEQQVKITANTNELVIQLAKSDLKLDEVQIIAYGETSRRLSTGTVYTVKSEEIARQPVSNPLYALQGRVPGLQVTPVTSLPGGAVNLQIRGKNSLNSLSDPLVVIDGIPITYNIAGLGFGFGDNSLQQLSALNFINPNDIESIDVLKDADATSIYGSRGANGVILISTKKGKSGPTQVNVNLRSGAGAITQKLDLMNTAQYLKFKRAAISNAGINLDEFPFNIEGLRKNWFVDVTDWDTAKYTDWQEALLSGTADFHDFQASISGGTPTIQYTIGGNYHRETTIFVGNTSDQKGSMHFSLTGASKNQRLRTTLTASYMASSTKLPRLDLTEVANTLPPNAPDLYTENGELNWAPFASGARSWENPLAEFSRTYEADARNLVATVNVNYRLSSWISLVVQGGVNELKTKGFRKTYPFAGRPPEEINNGAGGSYNESEAHNINIDPQIKIERQLGHFEIDAVFGGTYGRNSTADQVLDLQGFTSDALMKNFASALYVYARNNASDYRYAGVFGRMIMNWQRKYLLTLSGRRDGSSKFGPGNQFGNFGSVGAGWIFTEEKWMNPYSKWLSFGKLRFSYGSSGNDGVGNFNYMERYRIVDAGDPYQGTRGFGSTGLFNPYFQWEVNKKIEFSLDLGFFNQRILLNPVYYRSRSDNQLMAYPVPSMAGFGGLYINRPALIQNSGVEVILSTENVKNRDFEWTTNINFAKNTNKLLKYPDIENTPYFSLEIGKPFYGVINAYKYHGVDPETGRYQFETASGAITSNPFDLSRNDYGQWKRINTLPAFTSGISNNFRLGDFSLNVFFQYTKQIATNEFFRFAHRAGELVNLPASFADFWTAKGDEAVIQKPYVWVKPDEFRQSQDAFMGSDAVYSDASFLRLKNLSLSYNFSKKLMSRWKMNQLQVFVQGQNLITLTKYKGLDPESKTITAAPPLRMLTAGLQILL